MHEDDLQRREVHPDTVAFLENLEGDPKWSRRAWTAVVGGGVGLLVAERLNRLFTKNGREGEREPLLPAEIAHDQAPVISNTKSELDAEPVRESVWDRKPGKIEKGEIVYAPIERHDGKKEYVSLQFVDESMRKTLLLVNGEECEQTADGFPIRVTSIELREGRTIEINGVAIVLMSGTSVWDAKAIADMHAGLKKDGEFAFKITALVSSNGMIRKRQKAEEVESEDEKPDVTHK